jgi:hypothetical protein
MTAAKDIHLRYQEFLSISLLKHPHRSQKVRKRLQSHIQTLAAEAKSICLLAAAWLLSEAASLVADKFQYYGAAS